jgi:hypothetical protein
MPEEHKFSSNRGRSRPASPPKPEAPKKRVEHELHMGLGDAVLRLIHVEQVYANIPEPGPQIVAERKLLVEALNHKFQLNLGLDCDENGIPDSIEDSVSVFAHSAKTSCCRISQASPEASEKPNDPTNPVTKGRGFFTAVFGKLGGT